MLFGIFAPLHYVVPLRPKCFPWRISGCARSYSGVLGPTRKICTSLNNLVSVILGYYVVTEFSKERSTPIIKPTRCTNFSNLFLE